MRKAQRKLAVELTQASLGARLDVALAGLVAGLSRATLQKLIRRGSVRLDGEVVERPGTRIEAAGWVEIDLAAAAPEPRPAAATAELPVVFADEHLVVVDKPAGMLSHGTAATRASDPAPSAADLADARFGPLPSLYGEDRPGIVHRLDRDTSGLLVIGRTEEALAALKRAFQAREVAKTYLAIVRGSPRFDSEWIEKRLGRSRTRRDRIRVVPEGEGREAATYYEVRERFREHALLAVFPKTGRTHQVRVHLASIGMPLLGEKLYVPRSLQGRPAPDAPEIGRQALHAAELAFAHPVTGEALRFESRLPADMQRCLEALRVTRP